MASRDPLTAVPIWLHRMPGSFLPAMQASKREALASAVAGRRSEPLGWHLFFSAWDPA
eukprot:COSAG01_NODE_13172_length_1625_cov_1.523591_3_plen_57_part_01